MFPKAVVLIFLLLGLSSSIAHAVPNQNQAAVANPCEDNTPQNHTSHVVLSSAGNKSPAANGTDKSQSGSNSTNIGNNNKGANKNGNPQAKLSNKVAASGNNQNGTGNNNIQTSQCLDASVLAKGSESDGLNNATAGTSASQTSTNNFINFCAGQTITNGQQVKAGSCNPIPMGTIASSSNIPSCKYVFPKNLDTLKANTSFTMVLALKNSQVGTFTNAELTYYSAPQTVNKQGNIIGHTHLVVEKVQSLTATDVLDPTRFAFFKGIDGAAAADGTVTANVTAGLPAGVYRFSTIGTSANHVPFLVAVAQHGSMEDAVYATVTADGNPDTGNNKNSTTTGNTNPKTQGQLVKNTGTNGKVKSNPFNSSTTDVKTNNSAKTTSGSSYHQKKRRSFNLMYGKD